MQVLLDCGADGGGSDGSGSAPRHCGKGGVTLLLSARNAWDCDAGHFAAMGEIGMCPQACIRARGTHLSLLHALGSADTKPLFSVFPTMPLKAAALRRVSGSCGVA